MNQEVEKYFADLPDLRKRKLEALHQMIRKLFPNATVDMSYKMPTYRLSDGWVAIANQKNYVSLYTCGPEHIDGFKEKHPDIKTGKGLYQFQGKSGIAAQRPPKRLSNMQ